MDDKIKKVIFDDIQNYKRNFPRQIPIIVLGENIYFRLMPHDRQEIESDELTLKVKHIIVTLYGIEVRRGGFEYGYYLL